MISRSAVQRGGQLALRRQSCAIAQRRGYAAAASSSGSYEPTEISGIKIASKDSHGPTTKLAIVAKAGTRYQTAPGLTTGLEEFAFKNTQRRSALRIVRESELLGGQLNAYHTREALVIEASFLRQDLPYFTELLAEVITQTKYTTHEYNEAVAHIMRLKQAKLEGNVSALALDSAHAVAFHTGLGTSLYPTNAVQLSSYLNEHTIAEYAESAYSKSNFAVVVDGANGSDLSKWVEPLFKSASAGSGLSAPGSKYYGGEQRTASVRGNSMVIAFPSASLAESKPELAVLSTLLGGHSSIKWSTGFSLMSKAAASAPGANINTANLAYSDAGLLAIEINGSAQAVRKAATEAAKAIKSLAESPVSKEDLTKAIANAKFAALTANELSGAGLVSAGSSVVHGSKPFQIAEAVKSIEGVTAEKVKAAAKALVGGKATVATVGDLFVLPFAEEIGLTV